MAVMEGGMATRIHLEGVVRVSMHSEVFNLGQRNRLIFRCLALGRLVSLKATEGGAINTLLYALSDVVSV